MDKETIVEGILEIIEDSGKTNSELLANEMLEALRRAKDRIGELGDEIAELEEELVSKEAELAEIDGSINTKESEVSELRAQLRDCEDDSEKEDN